MLKFFRNQKDSWFVKGILILTALSFMSLFGIQGTAGLRQSNKTVFKTNGVKLSAQNVLGVFDKRVNEQRLLTNGSFSMETAVNTGMFSYVLNELVAQTIAEQANNEMNIFVSDDDVRQVILNQPIFLNTDGTFSRSAYQEFFRKTGKTEKDYVKEQRELLRNERLFSIASKATVVPDVLAKALYKTYKEKRSADVIRLNEKDMKVSKKPSDKELNALYDDLSEQLIAPEYRKLSVLTLTLNDVYKNIPVSDEELKRLYDENASRYITEETREVNQMLFDEQESAQKAYQAVKKGQNFFTVAEKHAHQTREQTSLGGVVKAGLLLEIADPVFEAKKGDLLEPIQTAFGWQVLQVTDIKPRQVVPFKKAKEELIKEYKNLRAYDNLMNLSVEIEDLLGEGRSLEDIAESKKLTVKTFDFVDMTGLNEKEEKTDIPQEILSVAFLGEEGQASAMTEQENGFFSVRVDEILEPQPKSFQMARKELVQIFETEQKKLKAKELFEKISAESEKNKNLNQLAKKYGLKVEKMNDFDRREMSLPSQFLTVLFNLKPNETAKTTTTDGYIIAKVTKINKADPQNDEIGLWELKQNMTHQTAVEKADLLLQDFSALFKTQINHQTVSEINDLLKKSIGADVNSD